MDRFTVISGCSGGGKSTLLEELGRRGFATVAEPGRRIVVAEAARGGTALPWVDMAAFARRAVDLARTDFEAARTRPGRVFFDRGLVDAAVALRHCGADGESLETLLGAHRYGPRVFLTPPWPDIFEGDAERRHGFEAAVAEYERLAGAYPALGYETVILPKLSVRERADRLLAAIGEA